ncbi:MAG: magnesium transporter [Firmicutes bacterium]|uniref:Magnesium transporter MgtE n=1 Tax=Melghirimyces thermohalophilus TaxID=1236220 RepID=A0A1G6QGS3_9BACL|nr:magnesium transporter [Melghirimyces thermohalophilus]MDA8354004.1 magnesium transporter [Bacillota bacterium]SDC91124.1 magnesium transporter [Melghirimyces thermohalophilus]
MPENEERKREIDLDSIKVALQKREQRFLRPLVEELQPYDLGQVFFRLPTVYRSQFVRMLKPAEIALLLEEVESEEQQEILSTLGPERTSAILNRMPSDKVADLMGELDESIVRLLLRSMERDEADKVRALLHYPEDTAGGKMTPEYVAVYEYYTVEEVIQYLRREAPTAETIYYIYVIDADDRLVGVISLRELLIASPSKPITEVMYERIISVPAEMDQEEVAQLMQRYDFLAIPVVDGENRLLGIITIDDVVDVLIEEAQEDISKLSAVGQTEMDVLTHPFSSARRRIPWLVLLLFIGMLTATMLSTFENTINRVAALAYFMPMVAGMTGNTGTQSLALVIRGLSSGQLTRDKYLHILRQEGITGVMIGTVCSVLIFFMVTLLYGKLSLGLVVGVSMWFTLLLGTIGGTLIPLLLNLLKVDPTVASGPLITTINDVFSLLIYFGFATLFLHYLL